MQGLSITMKSFALILVLALAAAAGAQPDRYPDFDRYRYGEHQPRAHRDGGWIELATPTPTRNGTEWFNIGRGTWYSQLRIAANDGRVIIRHVTVMFADGGSRVYRIDRAINGHRDVLLRLDGQRRISQIAVTPDRDVRGTYTIYGS
jgi:hypothetical protein